MNRIDQGYCCFYDPAISSWYLPATEAGIIEIPAGRSDGVMDALSEIESWTEQNQGCAIGYISYQAAPAFDSAFKVPGEASMPLVSFRLFKEVQILPCLNEIPAGREGTSRHTQVWSGPQKSQYSRGFKTIKSALESGDTYQVNYTGRFFSAFEEYSLKMLMEKLARPAGYFGRYSSDEYMIFSYSPELFFRKSGSMVSSFPMKGTAPRNSNPEEDAEQRNWLMNSAKNRAENLMIVDMIRNDLGKIAIPGSISVKDLYKVETYPYVHQMVSRVSAETEASWLEILKALFPCASITGAPKVRTMEIIAEIEPEPREIYTGTLGIVLPGGNALFNVAIRTLWFNSNESIPKMMYGAGGGIVWDSSVEEEWKELHIKTGAVT